MLPSRRISWCELEPLRTVPIDSTFHGSLVIHVAREFHDPVMYFDADHACNHSLFLTKLSEHVVLNLHIVCHQSTTSVFIREFPSHTGN